jgi:tetratricopeptide (TPR) repeat protein
MNRVLVTFVLALTTTAVIAQGNTSSQPSDPQEQPGSKKQIQDPAEYNAYIAALNTQDPAQKAAAMEAFINQYPKSVVKIDALEQAMAAYEALNNQQKVVDTAKRILQEDPNSIRALAIVTAIDRGLGTNGDAKALQESCDFSQKGLRALPAWPKPDGMAQADFEKLKTQMTDIFEGAQGFCALQAKDNAGARTHYLTAIQIDPSNMQDFYQLAIAELEMNPMDLTGFWYAAKAINLAGNNAQAVQSISGYVKAKYKNYHGSYDGWDQIVAAAATQTAPPPGFATSIKPKPTLCDIAVDAVKNNDPATLSFSDWEFVLSHANCSPANKEAADKVWQTILSKQKNGEAEVKLKLPKVLVISATKTTIQAAMTEESQQAKKADLTVMLEKPVLHPPDAGTTVDVVGQITSYTPDPFMFTMEKGEIPGAKTPPKKGGKKKGRTTGRKKPKT